MKKKTTQTGSTSTNPTAILLPLDADGFARILETIAGETPEDFASKQSGRRIESAHRLAWCEVTEAMEKKPTKRGPATRTKLAEVSAQRKLTAILDGLMPAIAPRNQTAAVAAKKTAFLCRLKQAAESIETEAATLKSRDCRLTLQGDMPDTYASSHELALLEGYLDHGIWKLDVGEEREEEFGRGLLKMIEKGTYTGEPTKDAVEQRIADLTAQVEKVNLEIRNRLDAQEALRLNELENKLPSIRAELTAAEDKASTMVAEAKAATVELKAKVEAAAIIARAIIQSCHIESGIPSAAV